MSNRILRPRLHVPLPRSNGIIDPIRSLSRRTLAPIGQCRLTKSGANLSLDRVSGRWLFVDGAWCLIPAAGVTLAPPATTLTNYFVYAYMNAGTMTLEASATAPAVDATYGHKIKTGDATRTLVGQARTVSSAWVDSVTQRFVRSWFHDPGIVIANKFSTTRSTTSVGFTELNSEIRCEALLWANENGRALATGHVVFSGAATIISTGISIDGGAPATYELKQPNAANYPQSISAQSPLGIAAALAEGYHYFTLMGASSAANNCNWDAICQVSVETRGSGA